MPSIEPVAAPLRLESDGTLRVGSSGVLLETVVRAYRAGMSPEAIAAEYDTLDLADVFGAIFYYLRHRQRLDRDLRLLDEEAEAARRQAPAPRLPPALRARLDASTGPEGGGAAPPGD
jgi:uncharacterized protein (DUF433 family)